MKNDYVNFEQSVKLKELGFDWKCNHYYDIQTKEFLPVDCFNCDGYVDADDLYDINPPKDIIPHRVSTPTLYQSQKWLRENHKLSVEVYSCLDDKADWIWVSFVKDLTNPFDDGIDYISTSHKTYEDVLLLGINNALKLLKEKINDKEK